MELGGPSPILLTFTNWEVPGEHSTSNLNYPCHREVPNRLWTFIELSGSWTTYDIDLEPPMESGGSYATLNRHGVERFRDNLWHWTCSSHGNREVHVELCSFMESRGSWHTFFPSWNRKVPDDPLFLHGIRAVPNRLGTFMWSRDSWPTWNLQGAERFLTNSEPSWNRNVLNRQPK